MSNQTSSYRPERRIAWQEGVQPPGTTGVPNQSSSFPKRSGIEIVREVDGSPSLDDITILEVPDGTLSNPGPGIARISLGAAATGGDSVVLGHGGGVPGGLGVRYLRVVEDTISSDIGFVLTDSTTLVGLSISTDFAHPTNTYRLEFLSDPVGRAAGPTVIAFIDLPATSFKERRRDLSVAIATSVELGARLVRTGGSGASAPLRDIIAVAEFSA